MKSLRKMDSAELMILIGIVAVIGLGSWNYVLRKNLEQGRASFENAKTRSPEIHALLKQIPALYKAREEIIETGRENEPSVYFQNRFTNAGIHLKSYAVNVAKETFPKIKTAGKRTKYAKETEISLDFNKAEAKYKVAIPRKNIFSALFRTESRSKRWKLRTLQMTAVETKKKGRSSLAYPVELSDRWLIKKLAFVSREPSTRKQR